MPWTYCGGHPLVGTVMTCLRFVLFPRLSGFGSNHGCDGFASIIVFIFNRLEGIDNVKVHGKAEQLGKSPNRHEDCSNSPQLSPPQLETWSDRRPLNFALELTCASYDHTSRTQHCAIKNRELDR